MRLLISTALAIGLIAPAMAQAPGLKGGRWQNVTTIAGQKPMTASECEDDRDLSDLDQFGLSQNPACVWKRRIVAGGVIDVAGDCPSSGGRGRISSTVKGSYTPISIAITTTTVINGTPVTMRTIGKRIGQCSPAE